MLIAVEWKVSDRCHVRLNTDTGKGLHEIVIGQDGDLIQMTAADTQPGDVALAILSAIVASGDFAFPDLSEFEGFVGN